MCLCMCLHLYMCVCVCSPVRSYLGTCPLASAYLYYVDGLESQKKSVISKSYITVCECVNNYVCVVHVCGLMILVPMCEKHQRPHTHVQHLHFLCRTRCLLSHISCNIIDIPNFALCFINLTQKWLDSYTESHHNLTFNLIFPV